MSMNVLPEKKMIYYCFLLILLGMLVTFPVTAVTLVDLELASKERRYTSDNPVQRVKANFEIPTTGWLTVTWKVDPYYRGFKSLKTRGGGGYYPADKGNEYLGPECQKEETAAISGSPYKVVYTCYVNNPQGNRPWVAELIAPHECQAFQVCNEGSQFSAYQRYTIEFESDSGTYDDNYGGLEGGGSCDCDSYDLTYESDDCILYEEDCSDCYYECEYYW